MCWTKAFSFKYTPTFYISTDALYIKSAKHCNSQSRLTSCSIMNTLTYSSKL